MADELLQQLRRKLYFYILCGGYHNMTNSTFVILQKQLLTDIKIEVKRPGLTMTHKNYSKSEFDYTLEKAFTENEAKFYFQGKFQGKLVTWHVILQSLDTVPTSPDICNTEQSQLIKISPDPNRANHYHALIRLNLVKLASSDIMKTIIMLRQYKNLSVGIHQWGIPDE